MDVYSKGSLKSWQSVMQHKQNYKGTIHTRTQTFHVRSLHKPFRTKQPYTSVTSILVQIEMTYKELLTTAFGLLVRDTGRRSRQQTATNN
jgi:hypothetical protein